MVGRKNIFNPSVKVEKKYRLSYGNPFYIYSFFQPIRHIPAADTATGKFLRLVRSNTPPTIFNDIKTYFIFISYICSR